MLKKLFSRPPKEPDYSKDHSKEMPNSLGASTDDLGARLRAEMLPASHATPHMPAYPNQFITPGRIGAILLLLGLLGLGWFFGIGPGRPLLENTLINLTQKTPSPVPTQPATSTPVPVTATETRVPTSTLRPSWTPTPSLPTDTATITPTETTQSSCRDFSTVTLADVGQELCVQGTILRVLEYETNTLIVFSDELGALYLVTYDVPWSESTIGTCYQVTGEIQQLLSSPVIIFGYLDQPIVCP